MALKDRIMKHPMMKKENLNPKTWIKSEHVQGFTDFILQKEPEADNSFDDEEMCKYIAYCCLVTLIEKGSGKLFTYILS